MGNELIRPLPYLLVIILLAQPISAFEILCTNPDFLPIVKEIGGERTRVSSLLPPGSDPHSFSLSKYDIDRLKRADLIILTNSELFSFENKIKNEYAGKVLDFDDYAAEGAKLDDFPGFRHNPHGYWLKIENAISIARAIEKRLSEMYPAEKENFTRNLEVFVAKMEELKKISSEMSENVTCVAIIPGVAYVTENAGINVGAILLGEGLGFASGREYAEIQEKLRTSEYSCIVVPESMKKSKAGEIAEQLSRDSGKPVVYVKFVAGSQKMDFSEIQIFNLMEFAKALSSERYECNPADQYLLYMLVLMVGVEAVVIFLLWRGVG